MAELSALDISALVQELQLLQQAKITKIYHPAQRELLFQLHSTSAGKQLLRIMAGTAVFLAAEKPQTVFQPSSYCLQLRKLLEGGVIREITQLGFERIVRIAVGVGSDERHLYLELFGKGNVVITDAQDTILSVMERLEMRDRSLLPKQRYALPPARPDPRKWTAAEFSTAIGEGEGQIVKQLAAGLGLGWTVAEELCARADMAKQQQCKALAEAQRKALFDIFQALCAQQIEPGVVLREGSPVLALPFRSARFPAEEQKPMPSMSAAVAAVMEVAQHVVSDTQQHGERNATIAKLQNILTIQGAQLGTLERETKEEQRKGELVYERYQELKELLMKLQQAFREKRLAEEAKQHANVRNTDTRTGTATIEFD